MEKGWKCSLRGWRRPSKKRTSFETLSRQLRGRAFLQVLTFFICGPGPHLRVLLDKEGSDELPLVTSARQKFHLEQALVHLLDFARSLLPPSPPAARSLSLINTQLWSWARVEREAQDVILASESLRRAALEIGLVSGREVTKDDVLDKLFGEFCIGSSFRSLSASLLL